MLLGVQTIPLPFLKFIFPLVDFGGFSFHGNPKCNCSILMHSGMFTLTSSGQVLCVCVCMCMCMCVCVFVCVKETVWWLIFMFADKHYRGVL